MITFTAIDTTDNQWLGLTFQLPENMVAPFEFPVAEGTNFRVDHIKKEATKWTFSNPHYVVVARIV